MFNILTKHFDPISGESRLFVKAAFFDANLSEFYQDASGLGECLRMSQGLTERKYGDRLESLGLWGATVNKPICKRCGVNRMRLALEVSLLDVQTPQLMLLDEPSNHLDEFARDALI